MSKIFNYVVSCILLAGAVFSTPAWSLPVQFDISGLTLTAGTGYGVDARENAGQLLDVRFNQIFIPQSFALAKIGDSYSFQIGSVEFLETDAGINRNKGIRAQELANLGGLSIGFEFDGPEPVLKEIYSTATGYLGEIADVETDYLLDWDPVSISFGEAFDGVFDLEVDDVVFDAQGTQNLNATITLRASPTRAEAVPEPGILLLLGLGLLVLGLVRRGKPRLTVKPGRHGFAG